MRARVFGIRAWSVRTLVLVVVVGALSAGALSCAAGSAGAAEARVPWWSVTIGSRPTALPSEGVGHVVVWAENLGDASTSGTATVTVRLPAGLTPAGAATGTGGGTGFAERGPMKCSSSGVAGGETVVTCVFGEYENANKEIVHEILPAYEMLEVSIPVEAPEASETESIGASVSGGGALRAVSASQHLTVGEATGFGIEHYNLIPEGVGGGVDTQAGSHPFQVTSLVSLDQGPLDQFHKAPVSRGLAKDLVGELPVGMFGNPTPFPQCTDVQFADNVTVGEGQNAVDANACPAVSAVGVAVVQFTHPLDGFKNTTVPIFNMTPLEGEPARFAFKAAGIVSSYLDTSVRSGGSYAVTVGSYDITEQVSLLNVRLTFWGVPGSELHDPYRGWNCLYGFGACAPPTTTAPLLVLPTSCSQPFTSTLYADSWGSAKTPEEKVKATYTLPEQMDGCNHLSFEPSITTVPDVPDASTSTGLTVGVHVPQEAALDPEGLAESTLKNTTVALPGGVAVNPSGGDGLEGCSEGLVGFTGFETGGEERALFTPRLPGSHAAIEAGETGLLEPGKNFCPDESKIATAVIHTPLLPHAIEGAVYLASQNANPFGSLIAMYMVAEDPVSGTLVKLPGEVRLCQTTGETISGMTCEAPGQLITTFKNTPELPFEELELHFFGGERAPLATPAHCGTYTTRAAFVPWSGQETINSEGHFNITTGPNGGPCPGAKLPFNATFTGGTLGLEAGDFSPLTTTISRGDGEQNMQSVTLKTPPGLSGLLSGVELCPEPKANEGLCNSGSQIGETTVEAGVGPHPVSVKGGKVFITGPYNGSGSCTVGEQGCAPFGLSIVNPVKAGPFDLEHDTSPNDPGHTPACDCIVVRAKIEVDPHTAALTVTTDSSGAHAIPDLIDGVPVQIQKVNVLINRPDFTFDPTSCEPMQIEGSIGSYEESSSPISTPFQAHDCSHLKFEPTFTVSTQGQTSKTNGASLSVKLAYPNVPVGTDANIKQVKVELPKQLPSRLTTLQKACTAAQFNANPGGCPAASIIGHAKAITPLIPVPLEGPAYFVSNGGEAFPNLIIVLQGYGVTIDLVGDTYISKAGITSSTFKTVPDAPVGSFELTLPEGPYSALAANGNLCSQTLTMPTEFLAQDGGVPIKQNTPITVTGCAPAITVLSHKVKNGVATIKVKVPAAGALTAAAKGLSKAAKTAKSATTLTVKLHLTKSETAFLRAHKHRKLKATIKLTFTPKAKGAKKLATSTSVSIG